MHLTFAGARSQMNAKLYQKRPGETQNRENLDLEPHENWINYVNIDLRHQYGIRELRQQRPRK